MNTEPSSHSGSALPAVFLAPTTSNYQQRERDLFPVCMLCEKHPKEIGEFFGLLGVKELAERRKGGRREVQKSTKLKWTFLFWPFLFFFQVKREKEKKTTEKACSWMDKNPIFFLNSFSFPCKLENILQLNQNKSMERRKNRERCTLKLFGYRRQTGQQI